MQDKVQNGKPNGNKWTPVAVAIVGAFLGSAGTISIYLGTPAGQSFARPDPFTGSQAATLQNDLDTLEDTVNSHVSNHPDAVNSFDRRIATLEAQYVVILRNQERILDRLDGR